MSWCSRMWGYSLEIVLKIQIALGRFFVWCVKPSGHFLRLVNRADGPN